jgi:EAL domain-containing protein (putative c-di-GMP-specific phosphodiesterase class I)
VLAEEAGLVAAIGMVVLEPACADIQTNQRACMQLAGLRSIFLAANSMTRAGFGLSQGVA